MKIQKCRSISYSYTDCFYLGKVVILPTEMLGYCVTDLTKVKFTLEVTIDTSKGTKGFPMTVTKLKSVRYLVVYFSHGSYANHEAEKQQTSLSVRQKQQTSISCVIFGSVVCFFVPRQAWETLELLCECLVVFDNLASFAFEYPVYY